MADETKNNSRDTDESVVVDESSHEQELSEDSKPSSTNHSGSKWQRFKTWYKTKKKISIPLTVLALLLILSVIPLTRFAIIGTVYKKDFRIVVLDSTTNKPVSGVNVSSGSASAQTAGDGSAVLHLSVGKHHFSITKKYYANQSADYVVPLLKQKNEPSISFVATGRQVKVTVTNIFSHQPLANVDIKFSDTDTKTDKQGNAIGVVPESTKTAKVTLSLDGYNSTLATVQASDSEIKQNNFTLTPAGKVYFLSKLSGKIDVVKTDLDGKNRATVLAGTGFEDDSNTVLLASRDWKYLALLTKRDSTDPKIYLITTSNDKLSLMESGHATFQPIGWDDNNFIYEVDRTSIQNWQNNKSSLKSFNALNDQITVLDNTSGQGTSDSDYIGQSYDYYSRNFYLINHNVVFSKTWGWGPNHGSLAGKTNGIYKIAVTGGSAETLKTYPFDQYMDSLLYRPSTIYYQLQTDPVQYFVYENGSFSANSSIKDSYLQYQNTYANNTYLLSPDATQTFWYEPRDGKNSLMIGDVNAANNKVIGRDDKLTPYGWFSNDYVLLSKSASELYILPKDGTSDTVTPYKVSDYHKPAYTYYGYGGGYGGL